MSDDPIVGHKTFRDGHGFRHTPLYKSEADALWASIEEDTRNRAALMPDEKSAIKMLFDAWYRLKELGWKEAIYCPKDGTEFDIIEAGSTGVFSAFYDGQWPDGYIVSHDESDSYVSRPGSTILCKPKPKDKPMANVYEGNPDGRQSADQQHVVSRFRPTYRALSDDEKALHDAIKTKATELEALFGQVKAGRYNSLAITSLEQSVMWIVKELTG